MAVLAPIPSAIVRIETPVKNGRFRQLAKRVAKTLDNSHHGSTSALQDFCPHLLQQAAYQVIVEEVFGRKRSYTALHKITRRQIVRTHRIASENGQAGGHREQTAHRGQTRRFLYLEKGSISLGTRLPVSLAGYARLRALVDEPQ